MQLLQLALLFLTFKVSDVKVTGPIEYGQPTRDVRYTGQPKYLAFGFNARPGDNLDVTVEAKGGTFRAWVTDAEFKSLAGGEAHFTAAIPGDSEPATYYVVVTESERRAGVFSLDLERPGGAAVVGQNGRDGLRHW